MNFKLLNSLKCTFRYPWMQNLLAISRKSNFNSCHGLKSAKLHAGWGLYYTKKRVAHHLQWVQHSRNHLKRNCKIYIVELSENFIQNKLMQMKLFVPQLSARYHFHYCVSFIIHFICRFTVELRITI